MAAYSSNQANEDGKSSDEEKEVEQVKINIALRAIETVKLWKL
jgi:hypothetical protein